MGISAGEGSADDLTSDVKDFRTARSFGRTLIPVALLPSAASFCGFVLFRFFFFLK